MPAAACKGPRSARMYTGRGLISRHRRCRLEDRAGVADRFLAGRLCRLNASGRYGSPPGGRPDSPAGSRSCRSLDSRWPKRNTTHSQKPDSRSCCSCSLDSRRPRNTTRRRRQQLFRKLRGDMPFGGRLQRSWVLAVVLIGHQHGQGIVSQSFATIEARRAQQPITRLQR